MVFFGARLVACGYSQYPGVDFSENNASVVHNITYHLLILGMIIFGLSAKIIDVETAFLYGDLNEEVYMDCPAGMNVTGPEDALLLSKCNYGLVQEAQQYQKKYCHLERYWFQRR